MPDERSVPAQWAAACARHPLWVIFCIVCALSLEWWFWRFPPRGYEATDVITLGEAAGEPLVGFPKLWDRLVNDDALMIEVMTQGGWQTSEPRQEVLRLLETTIRPGLSYRMTNAGMAEIRFHLGTPERIRPFLQAFTARILAHLRLLSAREYEKRLFFTASGLEILTRRRQALQNLFGTADLPRLLVPASQAAAASPSPEADAFSGLASASVFGLIGRLTVDSVLLQETMALRAWKELTASEVGSLDPTPREPLLLTDPASPPRLIQPGGGVIALLLPIGWLFLCLAGVMLLEAEAARPRPQDAGSV
ncbi:MAG TPA: hypothetical protein PLP29_07500 [Candidatus Ozemobacteraceae bacterium]|nr:hypothetical protein [Candidatus Ozemobacteraceae bacterium]